MTGASISIIIVTRNTSDVTLNCLGSIAEFPPKRPYEVIVVDNASSDGTKEAISKVFADSILVALTENTGFPRANNLGVASSCGEYLLFLNSDTLVEEGAIDALVDALESNPKAAIAAPALKGTDGGPRDRPAPLMTPATILSPISRSLAERAVERAVKIGGELGGIAYFCGAATMVKRRVFEDVGGYDEGFFFYCEDPDFCKRVNEAGWSFVFVPESSIVHIGGVSAKSIRIGANIERIRGKCRYISKHYGSPASVIACIGLSSTIVIRFLSGTALTILSLGRHRKSRRNAHLYGAMLLWLICGMPGRGSWLYKTLFDSWQLRLSRNAAAGQTSQAAVPQEIS